MDLTPFERLLDKFGFPVFVAVWLLWERKNVANLLVSRMDKLIALLEDEILRRRGGARKELSDNGRTNNAG